MYAIRSYYVDVQHADQRVDERVGEARGQQQRAEQREVHAEHAAIQVRQVHVHRQRRACQRQAERAVGCQRAARDARGCRHVLARADQRGAQLGQAGAGVEPDP